MKTATVIVPLGYKSAEDFARDCDLELVSSKMLPETRIRELLDYASSYGTLDENSPNGTPCQHGGFPMDESRRAAIRYLKIVLGDLSSEGSTTLPPDTKEMKLDQVTAIAIEPGNALASDYARGMANGLILAQSIFKGDEPRYIDIPEPTGRLVIGKWVVDFDNRKLIGPA